jgi:CHRD domain
MTYGVMSCSKKSEVTTNPNEVKFEVALLGKNEVPETISMATGMFKGTYNKSTKILAYTLTYTGMTPNAAHFHKGASNTTGAVVINIATAAFATPLSAQTTTLNVQNEKDLLEGNWYVNVHSALYPNGEIRGQLVGLVN